MATNLIEQIGAFYGGPKADEDEGIVVEDLDDIYNYLWLAGPLRNTIRQLHHQRACGRNIVISEKLHLISDENNLFIKPIPYYLLNTNDLLKNSDVGSESLNYYLGFLSTYHAMVRHPSDLFIANELHLFPIGVSLAWSEWLDCRQKIEKLLDAHVATQTDTDQPRRNGEVHFTRWHFGNRYDYGELRLGRLDKIMALLRFKHRYKRLEIDYSTFSLSFISMLTFLAFAFISIALSFSQVATSYAESPGIIGVVANWLSTATWISLVIFITLPSFLFVFLFVNHCLSA